MGQGCKPRAVGHSHGVSGGSLVHHTETEEDSGDVGDTCHQETRDLETGRHKHWPVSEASVFHRVDSLGGGNVEVERDAAID